jgi:DNA-directed RNA polymerase specialized sigma subunit
MTRNRPRAYEEVEAACFMGLCHAARLYDPAVGVRFTTFAASRVRGAALDAARELMPKGFRRCGGLRVLSLDAPQTGERHNGQDWADTVQDSVPNGELPVGWEIESLDEVDEIASQLTAHQARVVRLVFTRAATAGHKAAAAALGCSESAVSNLLNTARRSILGDGT